MSGALPDWLAHRAATMPGTEALRCDEGSFTYADLNQRVLRLAGALQARGAAAGDRIAVLATNSLDLVEAIHAVPRMGAVLVLLNGRLTASELAFQLSDAGVTLLVCHAPTAELAARAAAEANLQEPVALPLAGLEPTQTFESHDLDDVHSIIYTSGTMGRPKGAMLTLGNFWASACASAFNLGTQPGDRWLACMPLFHVGGLSIVLRCAIYGTTVVLQRGFDERAVTDSLHDEAVTHVSVVPAMLQRLLDADARPCPASLRVVLVGGGPVPPQLLARALSRGFPVIQTYGLTEAASQVATLAPADAARHVGSAGKPLLVTQLRIDSSLPGEPGEILVAGPTVTPGYFANPAATAAALREGWLHTGDIGRLDDDGFLFVLDRRDDLIVCGGENVYPAEVEAAALSASGVLEAAVVGVSEPRWGQLVAAVLVCDATFDRAAFDRDIRTRLAGYKVPRIVVTVGSLPRTASGKIQRRLVRELLTAQLSEHGVAPGEASNSPVRSLDP